MENFSLFRNIWHVRNGYVVGIDDIYSIVRHPDMKAFTDAVRMETNKEDRNFRKSCLPYITVNGVFSERNENSLMEYSGITCLDFDHIPYEELDSYWDNLCKWKYTYMMFRSPSGDGIKLLVRHGNTDPALHTNMYEQLVRMFRDSFSCPYIDTSVKDISRATYLPYDSNCFLNKNAERLAFVYDPSIAKTTVTYRGSGATCLTGLTMTPDMILANESFQNVWSDKSLINYIEKHQWNLFKQDYEEGNRNYSILRKAGQLYRCGVSYEAAEEKLVRLYSHVFSDLPEEEVKSRVSYIYKKESPDFGIERKKWIDKHNSGIAKMSSQYLQTKAKYM